MNTQYRKPLAGTRLDWFDAQAAVDAIRPGSWKAMPYTARVHAENIVRKADPARLGDYLGQLVERRRDLDFPWFPARVVCHDILGQTALVDSRLRDASPTRAAIGKSIGGAGAADRRPLARGRSGGLTLRS